MPIQIHEDNRFKDDSKATPASEDEYPSWLNARFQYDVEKGRVEYTGISAKLLTTFTGSLFWTEITEKLKDFADEFRISTSYDLFTKDTLPQLHEKSFSSFLNKTYRQRFVKKSVPLNEPPPNRWYEEIDDVVRTLFVVKYLDGVDHILEIFSKICNQNGLKYRVEMKCNDNGYYAAHFYVAQEVEYVSLGGGINKIFQYVEVQITTQLQEVLRQFSHKFYEKFRVSSDTNDVPWQWRYKDDEFFANYLGHMLHNIEGVIMEVRRRQDVNNASI